MRRLAPLLILGLLLAACGSSGAPKAFVEQPGALPSGISQYASQLVGSMSPDAVPLVQRNFLEGCMSVNTLRFEGLSGAGLAQACGCSYNALVSYLIDNQDTEEEAFTTFTRIDKALDDDIVEGAPPPVGNQYTDLFQDCRDRVG